MLHYGFAHWARSDELSRWQKKMINRTIINTLDFKAFSGQGEWLATHGLAEITRLFDEHGWREGWQSKSEIAQAMYPKLSPSAARNYLAAMLAYLVAEGRTTGAPQVQLEHGKLCFDVVSATARPA
jgi:hypothetical protein